MDMTEHTKAIAKTLDDSREFASVSVIEETRPGEHVIGIEPHDGELFFLVVQPA